ncbi:MAG: RsmE family RNA methyltransferase [Verrucomicrobiota bacterium]
MARYRSFILPEATVGEKTVTLDSRESHHLVKVLRARIGESVELLDGRGSRFYGTISEANAKSVQVSVENSETVLLPKPKVTLVQSISKGKAMDLILRIATEIGASVIQPVFTHHGEVQIKGERLASKVEKWNLTMIESCKQCGLPYLPELGEPATLSRWLERKPITEKELCLVGSLEAGTRPLLEVLGEHIGVEEVFVAIGPEGDFSPEEYAALRKAGFTGVRLGVNVLRAETASAYILSVIDQCLRA